MDSLVGDVNSSLMTYRRLVVSGIEQDEPEKVLIGIDCMMELLLDDYALHFSDTATMDVFKEEYTLFKCDGCGHQINTDSAEYTQHTPAFEMPNWHLSPPAIEPKSVKMIVCPECNSQLRFIPDRCYKSRNGKRLKLLPYPPKVDDIMTSIYNMGTFRHWARCVLRTVERHHRIQREHIGARNAAEIGI